MDPVRKPKNIIPAVSQVKSKPLVKGKRVYKKRTHNVKTDSQMLSSHSGVRELYKKIGGTYFTPRVSKMSINAIQTITGESKHTTKDLMCIMQMSALIAQRRGAKTIAGLDTQLAIDLFALAS